LSLDSLSIYKDIDIVSAKPTKEELKSIRHFGINEIYPNEYFSVTRFIDIYQKSIKEAKKRK
jgi:tRNA dimethylallyltransferase